MKPKTDAQRLASSRNARLMHIASAKKWKEFDKSFPERFWKAVDIRIEPGCWRWLKSIGGHGYGQVVRLGNVLTCHRVAYELWNETIIPKGIHVCHKCDNKWCCNPNHLFLGTMKDNMQDCIAKKRFKFLPKGESSYRAILNEEKVKQIRSTYALGFTTYSKLGTQYGVAKTTIQGIIERNTWRHVN